MRSDNTSTTEHRGRGDPSLPGLRCRARGPLSRAADPGDGSEGRRGLGRMIPFGQLIYDCTLREGMQSVYGPMFSHELRMEIAERLSSIGIRKIELGGPAAGPRMRESIR